MKDKFYHPELDCIRFFAFAVVFLHHFVAGISLEKLGGPAAKLLGACAHAGGLGVDLFFCLSSFLITTLLVREYDLNGRINVRAFWIRRILRIWPLYYFFVLFSTLVVPWILTGDKLSGGYLVSFLFFGANWACVVAGYPHSVSAPLWSVSIEEQFYLAWPLLLSLVTCRRLPHLAVGCLVVATITRFVVVWLGLPELGVWCNTFARLDPIALGALFAVFAHGRNYAPSAMARAGLLALGLLVPLAFVWTRGSACFFGYESLLFYPIVACCCVAVLAAIFRGAAGNSTFWSSKSGAAFVYLGRISYGLYVFHVFAIKLSDLFIGSAANGSMSLKLLFIGLRFGVGFGLTLGLAAASYAFLEKPFLRLKERFTYVKSAPDLKGEGVGVSMNEAASCKVEAGTRQS